MDAIALGGARTCLKAATEGSHALPHSHLPEPRSCRSGDRHAIVGDLKFDRGTVNTQNHTCFGGS